MASDPYVIIKPFLNDIPTNVQLQESII
jgi:hypothetical protein